MPDIGKCVRVKATGWVHSYSLYDEPRFDPEIEEVIECESLDAVKPQSQIDAASVPKQITGTQAKLALLQAGLYEAIETYVNAAEAYPNGVRYRIVWDAANWLRNSPELGEIAGELGLDDGQIDDLFRRAATL